jgi:CTP:molybdopterin cytidylyltransferase MocA
LLVFSVALFYPEALLNLPVHQNIVPIILTAGRSRHLPFPKALGVFGNSTAIDIAVANCQGLRQPIVVLGSDADLIRPAAPKNTEIVLNPRWQEGQLSSLLAALQHVPAHAAFMLYPVDHPLLQKETVQQLVTAFCTRTPTQKIAMPRHNGSFGHPVILAAELREEIMAATTAREVVYRLPERINILEAQTSAIYDDFDTPESYRTCVQKFEARR